MNDQTRKKQRERTLLVALGFDPDNLPAVEPPRTPTQAEIDSLVADLLDANCYRGAHYSLEDMGTHAVPALRQAIDDPRFLRPDGESKIPSSPLAEVLSILKKLDRQFIASEVDRLVQLPSNGARKICIEVACSEGVPSTATLLARAIDQGDLDAVKAALNGIRDAHRNGRLSDDLREALYPVMLGLCLPDSPHTALFTPATIFCEVFHEQAKSALAHKVYFSADSPHLSDIVDWLPEVVDEVELSALYNVVLDLAVRVRTADISDYENYLCRLLLPLAAARIGTKCQDLMRELSAHRDDFVRAGSYRALAIIECGHDPLRYAWEWEESDGFDALTRPYQTIVLVYRFDAQTQNGNVTQFLRNPSGLRTRETLVALQTMGDVCGEELLSTAIDALKSDDPHEAARRLSRQERKELEDQIDPLFAAYCRQPSVEERISQFVLKNREQFSQSPPPKRFDDR